MAIQIYGYAGSTCCGRVLLTLFEKNVDDYKISHVDLYKREHKSPEFLKHQVQRALSRIPQFVLVLPGLSYSRNSDIETWNGSRLSTGFRPTGHESHSRQKMAPLFNTMDKE